MQQQLIKSILLTLVSGLAIVLLVITVNAYLQDTITPNISDWPQHQNDSVNGSWCGVAALQAKIDWDWREHHNDYSHFHTQEELWDYARDHTSSDISIKGVQGRDEALSGVVGNGWTQVRKLNISYDFGIDPHAVAWLLWKYGPSYYHYWIYDNVDQATWALLWTLENYHEPVVTAVLDGAHWVLVIGYESLRSATNLNGMGEIYSVRYADPLYGPATNSAYKWIPYDGSIHPNWSDDYFTNYTDSSDPDPATGWYASPPEHWRNHWVTVERDYYSNRSPDWAMGPNGPIMPYHWPYHTYLPLTLKNYPETYFYETFSPTHSGWIFTGSKYIGPPGRPDGSFEASLRLYEGASGSITISVPPDSTPVLTYWCRDELTSGSYARFDLYLDGVDTTPGIGAVNLNCSTSWTGREQIIDSIYTSDGQVTIKFQVASLPPWDTQLRFDDILVQSQ